jgi:hypothetical protein
MAPLNGAACRLRRRPGARCGAARRAHGLARRAGWRTVGETVTRDAQCPFARA